MSQTAPLGFDAAKHNLETPRELIEGDTVDRLEALRGDSGSHFGLIPSFATVYGLPIPGPDEVYAAYGSNDQAVYSIGVPLHRQGEGLAVLGENLLAAATGSPDDDTTRRWVATAIGAYLTHTQPLADGNRRLSALILGRVEDGLEGMRRPTHWGDALRLPTVTRHQHAAAAAAALDRGATVLADVSAGARVSADLRSRIADARRERDVFLKSQRDELAKPLLLDVLLGRLGAHMTIALPEQERMRLAAIVCQPLLGPLAMVLCDVTPKRLATLSEAEARSLIAMNERITLAQGIMAARALLRGDYDKPVTTINYGPAVGLPNVATTEPVKSNSSS